MGSLDTCPERLSVGTTKYKRSMHCYAVESRKQNEQTQEPKIKELFVDNKDLTLWLLLDDALATL